MDDDQTRKRLQLSAYEPTQLHSPSKTRQGFVLQPSSGNNIILFNNKKRSHTSLSSSFSRRPQSVTYVANDNLNTEVSFFAIFLEVEGTKTSLFFL